MRRSSLRSTLCFVSLTASAVACGEAPPPPAEVAAVPVASAAAQVAAPSLPDDVADLGAIVPGDAGFVVELPSVDKLGDLVPAEQRGVVSMLRPFAEGGVADKLRLDSSVVHALVDGIERATIFGDVTSAAAVARFRDRAAVEKLVAAMKPVAAESTPGVREAYSPAAAPAQRLVWYPRPRILVWATSAIAAQRVERTGSGEAASFAKNPRRLPDDAAAVRVYADLASLVAKDPEASRILERGSAVRADVGYDGKALRSKTDVSLVGTHIPRIGSVIEANKATLAARLPEETILFASLSIARRKGKTLGDLVTEIGRAADKESLFRLMDAGARSELGLGLDDLDALLGGEVTLGVASAPGARIDLEAATPKLDDAVFFAAAASRDDARAKKLVAGVAKLFAGKSAPKGYKVSATPSSVRFTPTADAPPLRFEAHKGTLVFEAGGPKWMERVGAAFDRGERTLGASALYAASSDAVEKPANGVLWADLARAAKAISKGSTGAGASKIAVARLLLGPSDRGVEMNIESEGGAEAFLVGSGAALAIFGVRRYLASAKTAEAKNAIGALARAATAAYEREQLAGSGGVTHRLCKSARAVPAKVPANAKYAPSDAPNADYNAGDDEHGWRCLKFAISSPQYYQYEYRQGGPYKGPARGGPDPGPGGFEVSAEGDLDGNGKTSLFTRIGQIDPKTHSVRLSTELFVSDEFE